MASREGAEVAEVFDLLETTVGVAGNLAMVSVESGLKWVIRFWEYWGFNCEWVLWGYCCNGWVDFCNNMKKASVSLSRREEDVDKRRKKRSRGLTSSQISLFCLGWGSYAAQKKEGPFNH